MATKPLQKEKQTTMAEDITEEHSLKAKSDLEKNSTKKS